MSRITKKIGVSVYYVGEYAIHNPDVIAEMNTSAVRECMVKLSDFEDKEEKKEKKEQNKEDFEKAREELVDYINNLVINGVELHHMTKQQLFQKIEYYAGLKAIND